MLVGASEGGAGHRSSKPVRVLIAGSSSALVGLVRLRGERQREGGSDQCWSKARGLGFGFPVSRGVGWLFLGRLVSDWFWGGFLGGIRLF